MLVADQAGVSDGLLDAIAELAAIRRVLAGAGVVIRPATALRRPPARHESMRFARTILEIAERDVAAPSSALSRHRRGDTTPRRIRAPRRRSWRAASASRLRCSRV